MNRLNTLLFPILLLATLLLALLLIVVLFFSCSNTTEDSRGFYYWKTSFNLNKEDVQFLNTAQINKLYLRFFDVEYNIQDLDFLPTGKILFQTPVPENFIIIPVVFITQNCLKNLTDTAALKLANNIIKEINGLQETYGIKPPREFQIDSDWTSGTRDIYFKLLTHLKTEADKAWGKPLISVTIRLHQIQSFSSKDIPPADRGTLMVYHTSNPIDYNSRSSILDINTAKNYLHNLTDYPLPLDTALPIFSWAVQFDSYKRFIRIIKNISSGTIKNSGDFTLLESNIFKAVKNTYLNNKKIMKGDIITVEGAEYKDCLEIQKYINSRLTGYSKTIILFEYDTEEIERITNGRPENIKNLYN